MGDFVDEFICIENKKKNLKILKKLFFFKWQTNLSEWNDLGNTLNTSVFTIGTKTN